MKCDSRSLLTSALSVIFMYHSIVKGSVEALWTKLAAPFFDSVGTSKSSDLLKKIKMNHPAGFPLKRQFDAIQAQSLSAYVVKNNSCLFERLFKVKKKGVFLFGISFFVLEIFQFLYYANEGSDDVIDRSTKTVQHSIKNISGNIKSHCL